MEEQSQGGWIHSIGQWQLVVTMLMNAQMGTMPLFVKGNQMLPVTYYMTIKM